MADRFHVVIPAAGSGKRMANDTPKQYLPLLGRLVIEWSTEPFLKRDDIARLVIAIPEDDRRFASLGMSKNARVHAVVGGVKRADSVLCGLGGLDAADTDWVLVHDAARPCLHKDDLQRLVSELADDEVGGLLAVSIAETLKLSETDLRVSATLPRDNVWRAMTPQMFRFGLLRRALLDATSNVTDEAMAIERLGFKPKLISGRGDNIKITVPEDLSHAEHILRQRALQ